STRWPSRTTSSTRRAPWPDGSPRTRHTRCAWPRSYCASPSTSRWSRCSSSPPPCRHWPTTPRTTGRRSRPSGRSAPGTTRAAEPPPGGPVLVEVPGVHVATEDLHELVAPGVDRPTRADHADGGDHLPPLGDRHGDAVRSALGRAGCRTDPGLPDLRERGEEGVDPARVRLRTPVEVGPQVPVLPGRQQEPPRGRPEQGPAQAVLRQVRERRVGGDVVDVEE